MDILKFYGLIDDEEVETPEEVQEDLSMLNMV
jgi:hypothetical protein